MGLSASQARLLSVTQRINNNELKSEILANNKIRLADENVAASEKYINALTAKSLNYNVYDKSGIKESIALTFNALSVYGDIKTQYGVMNMNGQVYVDDEMANKFNSTDDLYSFLSEYGLVSKDGDGNLVIQDSSKAQWYTNMWYKMDGQDEVGIKYSDYDQESQKYMTDIKNIKKQGNSSGFVVLDSVLASSSSWLQFALENGLATLSRVQVANDDDGTNYWNSIELTSATDIVEVDNETDIARAEVEYQEATRRIQAEDKKMDQDIKKLDTERSALTTEYESIKNVLGKNVERSFTAFS